MRALTRPLVALALAGAAVAAPAATAAVNCFGPDYAYVCVTTPTPVLGERTECVYVGGTTCREITVPTVTLSGRLGWYCGGDLNCVQPA